MKTSSVQHETENGFPSLLPVKGLRLTNKVRRGIIGSKPGNEGGSNVAEKDIMENTLMDLNDVFADLINVPTDINEY